MLTKMLRFCGLIICTLFAGQAWAETCNMKDYGALPVDMLGGRPTAMIKINGSDTRFFLDTGVMDNTMSKTAVSSLGLKLMPVPDGWHITSAEGYWALHSTRVESFELLGTILHDVQFLVNGADMGYGQIGANLLVASDLEIDLAHGKLSIFSSEGCDDVPLAYWAKGSNYSVVTINPLVGPNDHRNTLTDPRIYFDVTINGKTLRALLDSGSRITWMTLGAAERAGIDLNAPGVKADIAQLGVSTKQIKVWTVNVESLAIGTETIQHSQVRVVDEMLGDHKTDLRLGVDFLLAHRVYIAKNQRKVYFTYNGGRTSGLAAPSDSDKVDTATPGDDKDAPPKTASDYARAGEAHLSRGEPKAAMAALNEAIRLDPGQAGFYFLRANINAADHQPDAVLADLDKSLSLDPKNVDALLMRAQSHITHEDFAGAVADVAAATPLLSAGSAQARLAASLDIQLEQPAAAIPLLDDWIRLHDNDPVLATTLSQRCWARALSNQMLNDALTDCHKAIERDGEKPIFLNSLGMVQLRLGNYSESIKAYEQAITLQPRYGWAHYGLGLAQIKAGQVGAGKAELATARMINPQLQARAEKYGLTADAH